MDTYQQHHECGTFLPPNYLPRHPQFVHPNYSLRMNYGSPSKVKKKKSIVSRSFSALVSSDASRRSPSTEKMAGLAAGRLVRATFQLPFHLGF
jgi:hypothetical protein